MSPPPHARATANGTTNPGYAHLPAIYTTMKSKGAKLLWSIGGWGSGPDYSRLSDAVRANLKILVDWTGADGIDLDPEPIEGTLAPYLQEIIKTIKFFAGGADRGERGEPRCQLATASPLQPAPAHRPANSADNPLPKWVTRQGLSCAPPPANPPRPSGTCCCPPCTL